LCVYFAPHLQFPSLNIYSKLGREHR
jgi:hypothetical protein